MNPDATAAPPPPATPPPGAPPSARDAWRLWGAVGWGTLLVAAAVALITGNHALGDVLDVGRWFR